MANSRLEKTLLVIFGVSLSVILLLMPLHAFISTWGGANIGPLLVWKSWKEILLLALVPLVIWYCIVRKDVARQIWQSWLIKLIVLYTLFTALLAITSQASGEAVLAGLLMNLRFLAVFILAALLYFSGSPVVRRIKKWLPNCLFIITIGLSVLAIAQVTVVPKDFLASFGYNKDTTIAPYTVVDSDPNALRAFATMRGPNPLGAYLLLPLGLALVTIVRQRRNILAGAALGLGVVALILTSSRSAWFGALAGLVVLALTMVPGHRLIKWIKYGAIPAILAAAALLWAATTIPAVRLAVFHTRSDRATLTEGSDTKHWQATAAGLKSAWQYPLGQGVGTSGPASIYNTKQPSKLPENYYVQLAEEIGWPGLALFVVINVVIAVKLWQRRQNTVVKALLASFIGIAVINFFLHGWSDDPTAITWWGIAGLYLFSDNKD